MKVPLSLSVSPKRETYPDSLPSSRVSCTNSPSFRNEYMPEGSSALGALCAADEGGCWRATAKVKSETTRAGRTRYLRTMTLPVVNIIACRCWITKEFQEVTKREDWAMHFRYNPITYPAAEDDVRRYSSPARA